MISRVHKMADLGFSDGVATALGKELNRSFNRDHFEAVWGNLLETGVGGMWKWETEGELTGIIAGMIHPDLFDGELIATEVVWYVSPVARSSRAAFDLWHEVRMWAQARSAVRIYAGAAATNPRLGQMFIKRGMVEMETYYTKDIA